MKPLHLTLATVLLLQPCACKKANDGDAAVGSKSPGATKSSARSYQEDHGGKSPSDRSANSVDNRDTDELIEAAENARNEQLTASGLVTSAAVEEDLAIRLNNTAAIDTARAKAEEAAATIKAAERSYLKAVDALRKRQAESPENERLSAFVAYADQRDIVATKKKEVAELAKSGPDAEAVTKARQELKTETDKLREFKAAWDASGK